jgi:hypothetical protein
MIRQGPDSNGIIGKVQIQSTSRNLTGNPTAPRDGTRYFSPLGAGCYAHRVPQGFAIPVERHAQVSSRLLTEGYVS